MNNKPPQRASLRTRTRRTVLKPLLTAYLCCIMASAGLAQAQDYPSRPIKIVVPFGPGSGTDIVARMIGEQLSQHLNTPVIVDNKAGASGIIGVDAAAKSPADGYTLLLTTVTTISANPFLFKTLPYDPVKDFQPLANFVETQMLLIVRAESPIRSSRELIDWLKANPTLASFGFGSGVSQIAAASYVKRGGATATAVPYKSSPQAITDLLGGQFPFMFLDQTTALPQIKSGRVRALASSGERRMLELPDVPTLVESGMPGFTIGAWAGIFAPAGIPALVQQRLSAALQTIMAIQSVRDKLVNSGALAPMGPDQFSRYLAVQRISWGEKIRDAGIQPE